MGLARSGVDLIRPPKLHPRGAGGIVVIHEMAAAVSCADADENEAWYKYHGFSHLHESIPPASHLLSCTTI